VSAADASTRKLQQVMKRLRREGEPPAGPDIPDGCEPILTNLIYSMALWEASSGQARAALKRMRDAVVDFNELRVCVPDEVASMLGERYPLASERCLRLRSVLNEVYRRQHCMSLTHLASLPKREARAYLDSLPGMPQFVSARIQVVCLGGHAVPTDERLRDLLAGEGVFADTTSAEEAASWLERQIKAEESLSAHHLFQAWSDESGRPPRRDRPADPPAADEPKPAAKSTPAPKRKPKARTGG
jgi:hypothetical protein